MSSLSKMKPLVGDVVVMEWYLRRLRRGGGVDIFFLGRSRLYRGRRRCGGGVVSTKKASPKASETQEKENG